MGVVEQITYGDTMVRYIESDGAIQGIRVFDYWFRKGQKDGWGNLDNLELMQFTGLLDKSEPCKEVYEGDIVDVYGKIIGNKYESPLVKGDSPILIEGFGTKDWSKTEASGLARGLKYSE